MPDQTNQGQAAEFDKALAASLSGPPAAPEFRGRLRERLVAAHMGAESDLQTRSARHAARRGRARTSRRPLIALALVAALAVAFVAARPALFPAPPPAGFGLLPQPALTPDTGAGGTSGPGYTFEFSYTLSGGLASGWPKLPDRQVACRMGRPEFTEQRVARLAARLGITAPVVREDWHDSYLLAADPGDGGPFLRMFPNGYTVYIAPYDYTPAARAELPAEARAVEIARSWLERSGFAMANSLGPGAVEYDLDNGTLYVRFKPASPSPVVTVSPFAIVQIGRDEAIAMGAATWFTEDASSEYPLRRVAQAWEDVKNGRGLLEFATREFPGPVGEDNVVRGQAATEQVRLAWALATAIDGTPFLVPVYAFSGKVTVQGDEGPVTLPFEVWAPAVAEEYVQR